MATRNTGTFKRNRHVLYGLTLLLTALFALQTLAGCADSSSASTKQTASQTQKQTYGPVAITPTLAPSALHGPANFLLRTPLNFTAVSGTTMDDAGTSTPLDAKTIKTGITSELQRVLFVVANNDAVNVYMPGTATPIQAQVTQHPDGSTAINYTHQTDSVTIQFAAALYKDQIIINYEQQYSPLITENASASDVVVTFTTYIKWVSANQIPAAPDDGQYQISANGIVNLTWNASQNAVAYHVYRMFPDQDQEFQLLGTVKDTSYNDKPAQLSQKLSTMGIAYAIFSVGSTGIENPTDAVISIAAQ
jgi:hypothetical protein